MGKDQEAKSTIGTWGDRYGGASLGLAKNERDFTELRLALATSLRDRRKMMRMTQVDLAGLMNSSQSRVAKMEAGDPTVSLDLLIRSLLALGADNRAIGRVMTFSRMMARTGRL